MADIITVMNLGWRYAAPGGGGEPIQGLRDASCYVQQGALAGAISTSGSPAMAAPMATRSISPVDNVAGSRSKSTLVKALAGIIPHCTNGSLNGYVRIADMNVKSTTVSDLSLRVGYVGQDPRAQLTSPTVAGVASWSETITPTDSSSERSRVKMSAVVRRMISPLTMRNTAPAHEPHRGRGDRVPLGEPRCGTRRNRGAGR